MVREAAVGGLFLEEKSWTSRPTSSRKRACRDVSLEARLLHFEMAGWAGAIGWQARPASRSNSSGNNSVAEERRMSFGWAGHSVEIDLTRGTVETHPTDPRLTRDYIAGKGLNARILWDRVPPEVPPFSPDNLLTIAPGLLCGTVVPAANRGVITFKSPRTGAHHHSSLGGHWPAEIKRAGFDLVTIRGRAPHPVYIWIHDKTAEIRDARHLWGKGTRETKRLIAKDVANEKAQIACIGPAGEHRVSSASLESNVGASASRGAIGAVFGDKNVKAIVAYGATDILTARPAELFELSRDILGRSRGPFQDFMNEFHKFMFTEEITPAHFGNLNETYADLPPESPFRHDLDHLVAKGAADWTAKHTLPAGCHNCPIACRRAVENPDGTYLYLKCQSWNAFLVSAKLVDFDFAMQCYNLCEDYGLDSVSVARQVAFAIDLYQNGILTRNDTDGLELEWGKAETFLGLIHKIAHREGIGEILSHDVGEAARLIGRGAEEYAHHTKRMEYLPVSSFIFAPYFALTAAISDRGDLTRNVSGPAQLWPMYSREQRDEYLKSGYFVYPKDYEQFFLRDFSFDGADLEPACQFAAYDEETYTIIDMLGLCSFWSVFLFHSPINSRRMLARLFSAATGKDLSEEDLTAIATRTIHLVRAYNLRCGMRRSDDSVAKLFFHGKAPEPFRTLDPRRFERWIDRYYELRGWNGDGVPTRESLRSAGLEDVREELERQGILASTTEARKA